MFLSLSLTSPISLSITKIPLNQSSNTMQILMVFLELVASRIGHQFSLALYAAIHISKLHSSLERHLFIFISAYVFALFCSYLPFTGDSRCQCFYYKNGECSKMYTMLEYKNTMITFVIKYI